MAKTIAVAEEPASTPAPAVDAPAPLEPAAAKTNGEVSKKRSKEAV